MNLNDSIEDNKIHHFKIIIVGPQGTLIIIRGRQELYPEPIHQKHLFF